MKKTENSYVEKHNIVFDYSLLKKEIKKVCGSQLNFAIQMGWSDRTATFKLNSKRYIKADEMVMAAEILGIAENDIPKYFLKKLK